MEKTKLDTCYRDIKTGNLYHTLTYIETIIYGQVVLAEYFVPVLKKYGVVPIIMLKFDEKYKEISPKEFKEILDKKGVI
jgi:hypothetical protein